MFQNSTTMSVTTQDSEIQPTSQAGSGAVNNGISGISASRSGTNEGISIMGFGIPSKKMALPSGQMETKCIVTLPINTGAITRDLQNGAHQVSSGLNITTGSQGIQGRSVMSLGNSQQIIYSQGSAMATLGINSSGSDVMKSNKFLLDNNKGSVQASQKQATIPSSDTFSSISQTTGPSSHGFVLNKSSIVVPPSGLKVVPASGFTGLLVRDRPSGGGIIRSTVAPHASTAAPQASTSPQSSGSSQTFTESRTPRIRCISDSTDTTEEIDSNGKINLECSETGSNLGGSDTCSEHGDEDQAMDTGSIETGSLISFGSNLDQGSSHTMTGSQGSEATANPSGIRRTKNGILLRDRTNR